MAASRGPRTTMPPKAVSHAPRTRRTSPTASVGPHIEESIDLTSVTRVATTASDTETHTGTSPGARATPDTLRDCHDDKDLWAYYKATADPYARERLILRYVPLVKFVAGKIGSGLPRNIDQGDLINDGMFGLFDAIEKFDPQRANKFETYAIQRVKGAIYDRLRTLDWIPRSVRTKMKAVDKAHQVLEASLRRTPTDDEVAAESGLTMRELRGVYKRSSSTSVLSLDEHIGHAGSTSTLGDMLTQGESAGARGPDRGHRAQTRAAQSRPAAAREGPDRHHLVLLRGPDPVRDRQGAGRDRVPGLPAPRPGERQPARAHVRPRVGHVPDRLRRLHSWEAMIRHSLVEEVREDVDFDRHRPGGVQMRRLGIEMPGVAPPVKDARNKPETGRRLCCGERRPDRHSAAGCGTHHESLTAVAGAARIVQLPVADRCRHRPSCLTPTGLIRP